ncbi:MAG: hypothetical protein M3Q08_12410 [Pseudomonadota bacterium]|nr:hypothetical protein [Pseudomonadota bacterium]
MGDARARARQYFRVKTEQLRAASALPSAEHAGLAGGHREELQRIYLRKILPQRYEIGRGMVYGMMHRSREADIVIWDALNYPSLPMLDHSFFFAESVRAIVESKSRWSSDAFADVLRKSQAVRDVVPYPGPNLDDTVAMLQLEVASLRAGRDHDGFLTAKPHIGTAAVFLARGSQALVNEGSIPKEAVECADDCWPDLLLLLEPGRVVVKVYAEDGDHLRFYDVGDDALMFFTHGLLDLLTDRVVSTEAPFYFTAYASEALDTEPYMVLPFRPTRPSFGRRPLWRGSAPE